MAFHTPNIQEKIEQNVSLPTGKALFNKYLLNPTVDKLSRAVFPNSPEVKKILADFKDNANRPEDPNVVLQGELLTVGRLARPAIAYGVALITRGVPTMGNLLSRFLPQHPEVTENPSTFRSAVPVLEGITTEARAALTGMKNIMDSLTSSNRTLVVRFFNTFESIRDKSNSIEQLTNMRGIGQLAVREWRNSPEVRALGEHSTNHLLKSIQNIAELGGRAENLYEFMGSPNSARFIHGADQLKDLVR
jgi:hypothetical protein